jgi:hypothetical protein
MKKLVNLPGTDVWVNPIHVVYVEQKEPYEKYANADRPRVEVYGRYRAEDVYDTTAAKIAALINGETA